MADESNSPVGMFAALLAPEADRWPKLGDKLLRPARKWKDGVQFAEHHIARNSFIWDGYMKGASLLVSHCKQVDTDRHGLIYVILFNYRHGLEVAIKWILDQYGRYAGITTYEKTHDLSALWSLCEETMTKITGRERDEVIEAVGLVVAEFHEVDASSFAFRYGTSKKGKCIPLPTEVIDLSNVQEVMEGVNNFFVGADGELDSITSAVPWDGYP